MSKKALLVISFGTTYQETRNRNIAAIEKKLADKFSDYNLFRAFTSRMVIKKMNREGIRVETPTEALERIFQDNYDEVLCQTTHVINGFEYEKTLTELKEYKHKFKRFSFGRPLLTSPGDYQRSAKAVIKNTLKLKNDEALFLMGHGTEHPANRAYAELQEAFVELKQKNIYVGTVEGHPEIDNLIIAIANKNITKIYLMPFMIVAGDHAQNDMAGDDKDSWKSLLESKGYIVEVILRGLGELPEISDIFVQHALDSKNGEE